MRTRLFIAVIVVAAAARAATAPAIVVDRIAAVVNNVVVKTSDIEREIRVTALLNGDPLDFSTEAKKTALNRLIDQGLIRREVQTGGYREPTDEEVQRFLVEIQKQRFGSEAKYQAALREYGLSQEQLLRQLRWQLTVLKFIDERFRPGVLVSDEDIERYYKEHYADTAGKPAPPLAKVRQKIEDEIAGERVNKAFYSWLEQARKQANPDIHEGALG